MVQIHGDIFVSRCSRCAFSYSGRGGSPEQPGTRAIQSGSGRLRPHNGCEVPAGHSIAPTSENDVGVPRCPECDALMRPGVVWFGEQLPLNELQRIENFLDRGTCDVVVVAGTTATFGYIIDWALRASHEGGELIEVNPEETPLSRLATRLVREPAAIALPRIVDELIDQGAL
jgi:NAD-dependent SIR2 family protein deacetylase